MWEPRAPRAIHPPFAVSNALGLSLAGASPHPQPAPPVARQPGSVLPNGVRNPWAPYEGGSYIPSSEGVANRLAGEYAGAGTVIGSLGGMGAGGSVIAPAASMAWEAAPQAGSVIVPSRGGASLAAGYRVDEGWNGSLGRAHLGHLPDASTSAARLGSTVIGAGAPGSGMGGVGGGGGSWYHTPSSWQNHARMTASMPVPVPIPPRGALNRSIVAAASPPPLAHPRRASLAVSVEEDDCPDCHPDDHHHHRHHHRPRDSGLQRVRSMSSATSSGTRHHHHRHGSAAPRPRRDSVHEHSRHSSSSSSPLKIHVADVGGDSPYQPLARQSSTSSSSSAKHQHHHQHRAAHHHGKSRRDSVSSQRA